MDWYEMDLKGEAEQSAAEIVQKYYKVQALVDTCEEILNSPESTPLIKRCAIDNAYKRIVKIMKGEAK